MITIVSQNLLGNKINSFLRNYKMQKSQNRFIEYWKFELSYTWLTVNLKKNCLNLVCVFLVGGGSVCTFIQIVCFFHKSNN